MKIEEYLACAGNFGFLCCSSEDGDVATLVPLHTVLAHIHMKSHQEGLSGCNSCTEKRKAESELETLCVVIFAYLIYHVLRNALWFF